MIIFDWDGTIIDSESVNNYAISQVLLGLGLQEYTFEYCTKHLTGITSDELLNRVQKHIKIKSLSKQQINTLIIEKIESLSDKTTITKNVEYVLERICIKKCIASNSQKKVILKSLRQTNLDKFFTEEQVFSYEQVKKPKPAPDIFLLTAKEMLVNIQECLVIEDSPTGVIAAKSAGAKVIGFVGNYSQKQEQAKKLMSAGADKIILNMSDLLNFI